MGDDDSSNDNDNLDLAQQVKSIPPEHAERLRARRRGYDRVYQLIQSFDELPPDTRERMTEVDLSETYVQPLFQALGWSVGVPISHAEGSMTPFDLWLEYQNLAIPLEIKGTHDPLALRLGSLRQRRGGSTWAILTNFETIQIWDLDQEELFLRTSPRHYVMYDQEEHDVLAAPIFYDRLVRSPEIESLISSLSDPNESIRWSAVKGLGKNRDPRAVEPLIELLSDQNESIRQAAVEALGKIGDWRAAEPLIELLSDPNESIRQATIEALGQIGNPLASRPLTRFLSDPNESIRLAAVEALGRMNISQAAEPLPRDLEDENASVQRAAADAPDTIQEITIAVRALSDAPSEVDLLGFSVYAEALADFIKNEKTEKPLTIGINAAWGMGKTTLMHLIREQLVIQRDQAPNNGSPLLTWVQNHWQRWTRPQSFPTVWFNAWKYDQQESLWAALALTILEQVHDQSPYWQRLKLGFNLNRHRLDWALLLRNLFKSLVYLAIIVLIGFFAYRVVWNLLPIGLRGTLSRVWQDDPAAFLGGAGILTLIFTLAADVLRNLSKPFDLKINRYFRKPAYQERVSFLAQFEKDYRRVINFVTEKGKWPLIVFVDDLDRCTPPKAAEVVEAINFLLDSEHCVFVVGMDSRAVAASIQGKYKDLQDYLEEEGDPGGLTLGQLFLEKIIQISFRIPQADPTLFESFVATHLNPRPTPFRETPPQDQVMEVKESVKAELRAGVGIDLAVQNVRETRPDLKPAVFEEARREIVAETFDDSEEVRTAIHMAIPYLGHNPRKIKRFINVFRLQAFIANRRGLLEDGTVQLGGLAKWTIISLCWPAVIDALNADRDFVRRLRQAHAIKEELRGLEQKYGSPSAGKRENLQIQLDAFLSDPRIEQLVQASDLIRLLKNMTDAEIEMFPYYLQ